MSLFDHNLTLLDSLDSALAERLRSDIEDESVVITNTSEGVPTLGIRRGNSLFLLHHPEEPLADTRRFLSTIPDAQSGWNFVVFGLGLAYVPLCLLESRVCPPNLLLLVEPSLSVFRATCQAVDLRPILECAACRLLVGLPASATYETLCSRLIQIQANQSVVIKYSPTEILYPDWMKEQQEAFAEAWRFGETSLLTKQQSGPQFISNLIENLPSFVRSRGVHRGKGILRGVPAVIVAAGPSLRKNMDRLPDLRKHSLLIAVDTVLDRLLDADIPPHLAITLDPSPLNFRHFRKNSYPGVRLAFDPESYPVTEQFGSETLTFVTDHAPFFDWLDSVLGPKGKIPKGLMVSHLGFHLAAYWGCDPIILVAQDLALDPDTGQTHDSEAAFLQRVSLSEQEVFWVSGLNGESVPTLKKLLIYLRTLERDILRTSSRVIDATEGGARIAGTEILSADGALARIHDMSFDFESFWSWLGIGLLSAEETNLDFVRHEMARRVSSLAESIRLTAEITQDRLDSLAATLFHDPVTEYLVGHLSAATLFDFFRWGPANADMEQKGRELHRRYTALSNAIRQTRAQLFSCPDTNA